MQPDLAEHVKDQQRSNLQHNGMPVLRNVNPFVNEDIFDHFCATLKEVITTDAEPEGYGVDRIDSLNQSPMEQLIYGRGERKELVITLTPSVWKPHIRLWCQAVCLLELYEHRFIAVNQAS